MAPRMMVDWRDARVAEGARLESECALIAHRGFESLSLRQELGAKSVPSRRYITNPARPGREQR